MALNPASATPAGRFPAWRVLVNGTELAGSERVTVDQNAHFSADSWSVDFPAYNLPTANNLAFWSDEADIEIEIQAGTRDPDTGNVSGLTSLIVGLVDLVDIDWDTGALSLKGRDYSGVFIDSVVTENFLQQTSSQIAQKLCGNHPQLTPQITATKTPVGRYYNSTGTRFAKNQTEWDLLTALAQFEGFEVLVIGRKLYFGPPITPDTSNPFQLNWSPAVDDAPIFGNVKKLQTERALTVARDIIVIVQSFNRQTGKTIKVQYKVSNSKRGRQSINKVTPQTYTYNIPNLTQPQAQQEAQARAVTISKLERIITGTLPGDPALNKQTALSLSGTGTSFDQTYYVDKLTHSLSVMEGYEMTVRAKNHSTYSTVPL